MIDAKEFLRAVKSLTEIQANPNVFKDATLTDDDRILVFWAASGRYEMRIGDAGSGVNVYMTQDGRPYRKWFISLDGVWLESESGENGEDFKAERQRIAQRLIQAVGSRPEA